MDLFFIQMSCRTITVTVVMRNGISSHMLLPVCLTEMYRLMVACLCVMVGNAETERCFSCQNHRDVPVDGRLPVRDGWECGD